MNNVRDEKVIKQTSMKDFFAAASKVHNVEEDMMEVDSQMEEIEEPDDDDLPKAANQSEEEEDDEPIPVATVYSSSSSRSNPVARLASDLGLVGGAGLGELISVEEGVYIVSQKLDGLIPVYNERKNLVDENCNYYQKNSVMYNDITAVERTLALFSSQFEDLIDNTCGLDDKTFGMKTSQILQFKNFRLKQATGIKTDIVKTALELLDLLPKINRKLQKRISNLKITLNNTRK